MSPTTVTVAPSIGAPDPSSRWRTQSWSSPMGGGMTAGSTVPWIAPLVEVAGENRAADDGSLGGAIDAGSLGSTDPDADSP
jgi:hypothetical protein